jgi:Zn-finger nucleic acid-binding protein
MSIATVQLHECGQCLGLWLDVASFEILCANREQQAAVLGAASLMPYNPASEEPAVRYLPCPDCSKLMNRINFARCSGVIVDVCRGHGTWFDHAELSRIVEFISAGGLEASRTRERMAIEEERKRLQSDLAIKELGNSSAVVKILSAEKYHGIVSARGLLDFLFE